MSSDLNAVIASRGAAIPSVDALQVALDRIAPGFEIEERLASQGEASLANLGRVITVAGLTFALLGVAAPLPREHLIYGPVPTLFWPTADQDLAEHTAHVRVLLMDQDGASRPVRERALLLVQITAALCMTMDAIGVLWCASDHLMSAARFVQIATTPESEGQTLEAIWVRLWVDETSEGLRVATHGLTVLTAGLEIELGPSKALDLVTLAFRAMQFAHYIGTGRMTLLPGATVAPEQFKVTVGTSHFDGQRVIRLVLEEEASFWNKLFRKFF